MQPTPPDRSPWLSSEIAIALVAIMAIALHLLLRFAFAVEGSVYGFPVASIPLVVALVVGGIPLVFGLTMRLVRFDFSSDLLAGISIVTAVLLGEYLAGTLVVLMLSGGQSLENYAVRRASSALLALAKRMPTLAHRKTNGTLADVPLLEVAVGDLLVVYPHETCPVDAVVVDGHSTMDESYLTGEPYLLVEGRGRGRHVRGDQRRRRVDNPGRGDGGRFAVREDHAGDARVRAATARTAAARRSTRRRGTRHSP